MVDDGRWTDGRTTEHGYTISSPCEPDGSGELKNGNLQTNYLQYLGIVQTIKEYLKSINITLTGRSPMPFIPSHISPIINQRTNGPVNAHLGPEIYTCTNKLVRLEWYNACI